MNQFFTHDQARDAAQFLYPDMVHGVHFLVLMGINADGSPASDAWIELWNSTHPEPTLAELKAVVIPPKV